MERQPVTIVAHPELPCIVIKAYGPSWVAWLATEPQKWEGGKTKEEAVYKLYVSYLGTIEERE